MFYLLCRCDVVRDPGGACSAQKLPPLSSRLWVAFGYETAASFPSSPTSVLCCHSNVSATNSTSVLRWTSVRFIVHFIFGGGEEDYTVS